MTTSSSGRPPLEAEAVAVALDGSRWRAEVLEASPSTNAVAAARLRSGEGEGLVVVADHQTAGRGRLDRSWETPAGAALTFSVLLVPDRAPVARWPWLPLLTGVAVAEAVRRTAGVEAVLKWPNDVLVGERKLAGILVERVETPHGAGAVVGVGLNVSQTRQELPVPMATSLELEGDGRPVDRVVLLAAVLETLAVHYDAWRAAGGDATGALHSAYTDLCSTVGRAVRVRLPSGDDLTGDAVAVDADGRLLVRGAHGTTALGAGDVVHVRPR